MAKMKTEARMGQGINSGRGGGARATAGGDEQDAGPWGGP